MKYNAILLSAYKSQACTMQLAHQLLQCGLGRVVKWYPFTIALKGNHEGNDPLADSDVFTPMLPNNNSWMAMKARGYNEQAVVF